MNNSNYKENLIDRLSSEQKASVYQAIQGLSDLLPPQSTAMIYSLNPLPQIEPMDKKTGRTDGPIPLVLKHWHLAVRIAHPHMQIEAEAEGDQFLEALHIATEKLEKALLEIKSQEPQQDRLNAIHAYSFDPNKMILH